jgi:signal transduction histidine kinase
MSPDSADEWGWLLGHDRSFARMYPAAWPGVQCSADSLTEVGYVASRRVRFLPTEPPVDGTGTVSAGADAGRFEVLLVSMLPRPQVWALSNQLLGRLLLLAGLITLPFSALARFWAIASVRRQQQHTRILASEKQLRELSARLLRIQEDERRAISREIHDELGQQVTAINLDLKLAGRDVTSVAARNQLQRAVRESELLLESLHRFAQRVRPSILDDLGLVEAINSHVRDFQQRTGIKVEVQHDDLCKASIGEVQSENVFRLLQESLTNVARHANASHVQVELYCVPSESPTMLALTVADDGNGRLLKPAADGQRLGVLGMQERVTLLNGRIDFDSKDDCGTVVRIQIPLYANNKEDQAR